MKEYEALDSYIVGEIKNNINMSEQDVQRLLEEKHDAEQFLRLIAPKYMGVYILNRKTDVFKDILGPGYFRRMAKDKKGKYFEALKQYRDEMVEEEYQSLFDDVIDYDALYESLENQNEVEFSYRKKDGTLVRLQIKPYSEDEEEKDLSIWIYINEEMDAKHRKLELQKKVIACLAKEYSSVWFVDGNTLACTLSQCAPGLDDEYLNNLEQNPDYLDMLKVYANKYVCTESMESFLEQTDYKVVHEKIKEMPVYKVIYKRNLNGKEDYYQLDFAQTDSNDFVMGFKNVNDIITEEKQKNEALQTALITAEHANQAKTRFLNSMSHDIRTPMNAIIGFTALAARDIDDKEKIKDYLKKITTSSSHLLSLINDVLDMSRIESGKMKIEEKEVHLPDVFHDLRSILQPDITSRGIDLFFDTLNVVDEDVICDRLRLNQILLNLLNNAMKFTRPGGMVSVRLIQKQNAPKGYASYEIHVKDNGIGMSEEFQKHVFDAFAREETATVSGIQGTGLGMAITKNIVSLMNGTISVNSKPGVGTEFIVQLQFRLSNNPLVYEKIEELQGVHALVVDDDMECCCSVCDMLCDIGLRPDWTTTGKEAIVRTRFAFERNDDYGVYIVDLNMPDMNGIETIRRIRKVIGNQTPIIVMTAYDWSDIEQEARAMGVTAFCSKPIFMSELRDVLSEPFKVKKKEKEEVEDFSVLEGKNILLVEDNQLNQEVAYELLKHAGLNVDVANDGDIAISKMRYAKEGQYDLILMDIQMPRMNGFMAAREIRTLSNPSIANIPILALSADAFTQTKKAAIEAGMNGHVSKPLNMDELLHKMKQILQ